MSNAVIGAVAVDTNVLLRLLEVTHPHHADADRATQLLFGRGVNLCVFPQNIREFWNVATRPFANNGLGESIQDTRQKIEDFGQLLTVLEDGLPVYNQWLKLVENKEVVGVKVHDAYLVAAMLVHGINEILTFNTPDFYRYADLGIVAIHPAPVPETSS